MLFYHSEARWVFVQLLDWEFTDKINHPCIQRSGYFKLYMEGEKHTTLSELLSWKLRVVSTLFLSLSEIGQGQTHIAGKYVQY